MTIVLTAELFAKVFPNSPKSLTASFVVKQHLIAEILATPERLALAAANIYAETSGYALAGLIENIHYTAAQMARTWPSRFKSATDVQNKYGTAPGWQNKAFDDIYGNRMGNRPNTNDGSTYIGRGGPQLTGRDEYDTIGRAIGVDLISNPGLASSLDLQPDILGAYWRSKDFSKYADIAATAKSTAMLNAAITAARRIWNGGTNGLSVVETQYPKLLKIINTYNPATSAVVVQAPTAKFDATLQEVQRELIEFGYHEVGDDDGKMGGKTSGAIAAFAIDRNLSPTVSYMGADLFAASSLCAALNAAHQEDWHRPTSPSRAFATTEQLAPKIASIAPTKRVSLIAKIGMWFGGTTTTVQGVMSVVPTAHDTAAPYIAMMREYWDKIPGWVPFAIVGAIAFAIFHQSNKANNATVADYQQGKIN